MCGSAHVLPPVAHRQQASTGQVRHTGFRPQKEAVFLSAAGGESGLTITAAMLYGSVTRYRLAEMGCCP